jgi:hypothetical protein
MGDAPTHTDLGQCVCWECHHSLWCSDASCPYYNTYLICGIFAFCFQHLSLFMFQKNRVPKCLLMHIKDLLRGCKSRHFGINRVGNGLMVRSIHSISAFYYCILYYGHSAITTCGFWIFIVHDPWHVSLDKWLDLRAATLVYRFYVTNWS